MTPDSMLPWLNVVSLAISIGAAIFMFVTSGAKETAKTVADHEERLLKIETAMQHMPDLAGMHKQALDISDMKGEIGIIKKSIEATERTTRRVEDFLMTRGHS